MSSAFRLVNAEIKPAAIDAIGLLASLLDTKAIRIKGNTGRKLLWSSNQAKSLLTLLLGSFHFHYTKVSRMECCRCTKDERRTGGQETPTDLKED